MPAEQLQLFLTKYDPLKQVLVAIKFKLTKSSSIANNGNYPRGNKNAESAT